MDQSTQHLWETIAQANGLIVEDESTFKVCGDYRGHYLELTTVVQYDQVYTKIIVSISKLFSEQLFEKFSEIFTKPTLKNIADLIAVPTSSDTIGQIFLQEDGFQVCYEQLGNIDDANYLQQLFDLLAEMADRYAVILTLGGEAVSILRDIAINEDLQETAIELLLGIELETSQRIGDNQPAVKICPNCLAEFVLHKEPLLRWRLISYYGCRECEQSRNALDAKIVLDENMITEKVIENGLLRVNWFINRRLFNFKAVEIIQASDEDVERFAVQIGNDTDYFRKPLYKEMPCFISNRAMLSENSIKILEQTFGRVEVGRN